VSGFNFRLKTKIFLYEKMTKKPNRV